MILGLALNKKGNGKPLPFKDYNQIVVIARAARTGVCVHSGRLSDAPHASPLRASCVLDRHGKFAKSDCGSQIS